MEIFKQTGIKRLVHNTESEYIREKKVQEIEEKLYFVIDENSRITDLSEKGMWHRVRVGPFTKIDAIKKTRSSLLQSGIKANLIKIHAKTQ